MTVAPSSSPFPTTNTEKTFNKTLNTQKMAPMLSSNNIRTLTHKVLFFFISFASVAIVTELVVPSLFNFAVNDLPVVWSTIRSCVKPPCLYLLINIIIVTISVSSYFHQQDDDQEDQSQPPTPSQQSFDVFESVAGFYEEGQPEIVGVEVVPVTATCHSPLESSLVLTEGEKPVVDFRFAQRKRIKTTPEGVSSTFTGPKSFGTKSLKVATEATVENDGYTDNHRHIPPTTHLQKSVTIENHRCSDVYRRKEAGPAAVSKKKKVVRKSATLKDRTNYDDKNHRRPSPESGGKKRKDGSLSNDELNRRVEEFIKKFNDEMRLQRQESVKQYRALTNPGGSYR